MESNCEEVVVSGIVDPFAWKDRQSRPGRRHHRRCPCRHHRSWSRPPTKPPRHRSLPAPRGSYRPVVADQCRCRLGRSTGRCRHRRTSARCRHPPVSVSSAVATDHRVVIPPWLLMLSSSSLTKQTSLYRHHRGPGRCPHHPQCGLRGLTVQRVVAVATFNAVQFRCRRGRCRCRRHPGRCRSRQPRRFRSSSSPPLILVLAAVAGDGVVAGAAVDAVIAVVAVDTSFAVAGSFSGSSRPSCRCRLHPTRVLSPWPGDHVVAGLTVQQARSCCTRDGVVAGSAADRAEPLKPVASMSSSLALPVSEAASMLVRTSVIPDEVSLRR